VVVEDDGLLRIDAVLLLEDAGFEVREFVSVDKAVAYLETKAATVIFVFTDVHTPGSLDGVALAQVASERWPWIKTLITSGTASKVADRIPAGSTFMRKPWRASEVLAHALWQRRTEGPEGASSTQSVDRVPESLRGSLERRRVDTTTILIIIIVIILLGGGGWYGRGRWF